MAKKKTRYAVCIDREHRFVGSSGKVSYTTDRAEADRIAEMVEGRVVDAEVWAKDPRFLPQASSFALMGSTGIEVGLSQPGPRPVTRIRIKRADFKSGLGRGGKRLRPATVTLVIEYENQA